MRSPSRPRRCGGTSYWNRYPGARCDIQSMDYQYKFDPELQKDWQWSEKYAAQPEILRYLQHVAERYDLRRDIRWTRVDREVARGRRPLAHPTVPPRRRQRTDRPLLRHGDRLPVCAEGPGHSGHGSFPGRSLCHRPLAPRGGRLHGQARRGDRHGIVGHPVHPADREAGVQDGDLPAHGELLHAGGQRSDPGGQTQRGERDPAAITKQPAGSPRAWW